jgi:hypothetical protein
MNIGPIGRFRFRWIALLTLMLAAGSLAAQPAPDHVVSAAELHHAVQNAAQARQNNLATLNKFVSSSQATKLFEELKVDPAKVARALPMLSDAELARLARQSEAVRNDPAAGGLGTLLLLAIVLAILLVVLVSVKV